MRRLFFFSLFLSSCSFPNGDEWQAAIANGRYAMSPLVCDSTNEPPAFRKPEQKLNFYAFENIKSDAIVIHDYDVWRILEDSSCHLTQRTHIAVNSEQQFALQNGKTSDFRPNSCAFSLNYGGKDIAISEMNTTFFDAPTQDEYQADVVFDVAAIAGGYRLTSSASSQLSEVWENYGCTVDDRIRFELTRSAEEIPQN